MVVVSETGSRRVASVSAGVAAVAGVVTALVVGAGAGLIGATVLAVLGGLAIGEGARLVAGEDPRRASGSVAVCLGAVALGGSVGLGLATAPAVTVALAIALLSVTVDAGPGFSWEGTREVNYVLRRSGTVVAVLAAVVAAVHAGIPFALAAGGFGVWLLLVTASPVGGVVVLAAEVLALVVGFGVVVPILQRWVPPGYRSEVDQLAEIRTSPTEVPITVYVGVFVGGLLALNGTIASLFAQVLDLLAPVGPLVAAALTSPLLHALPTAVLVAFALVVVVELVRRVVVVWLSPNPPRSGGRAAGGVVAVPLVLGVAALPPVSGAVAGSTSAEVVAAFGVGTVLMGGAVLAMAGLWITLAATLLLAETKFVDSERAGFTIGSALLFLAAVLAALRGAGAPATFAGVAGAILVFDVGEHATDLGAAVAPGSETRRAEVVHATASGLVGGVAVVAALVGAYVVVPVLPRLRVGGGPSWAPSLALLLALVALVAYLRLLGVREESRE